MTVGIGGLVTPGTGGPKTGKDTTTPVFTDDEKKAIDAKMKQFMDEGKSEEDARNQATREVCPDKMNCAGDKKPSQMSERNAAGIEGGNYTAYDCKNGWFMLRDIPLMSAVKKGTKGAPEDKGIDWLKNVVKFHGDSYSNDRIAYPLHEDHKDDMGFRKTRFAGYHMPKRVGLKRLKGKDVPTVFGDLQVKPWVVEKMQKGELSFLSPEIGNWNEPKLSSIALMDTDAPFFSYPALTVSKIEVDENAHFDDAHLPKSIAKFHDKDGDEYIRFDDEEEDPEMGAKFEELSQRVNGLEKKLDDGLSEIRDALKVKPNPTPAEDPQGGSESARMAEGKGDTLTPAIAAKFAEQEQQTAELKQKLAEREAKEKAEALFAEGLESLKGHQIGDGHKKYLRHFAEKGERKDFDEYVEHCKASCPPVGGTFDELEREMAQGESGQIAKFLESPEKAEKAKKFAEEYRRIKASPAGKFYDKSLEDHVRIHMEMSA